MNKSSRTSSRAIVQRGIIWRILAFLAWSIPLPAVAASVQPIETFTLKNGLQVIVLPNHRVPAVNHMLWFRVGAADDPQGKSGLAHYHEHLMFKGSPKFPGESYTKLLDKHGGDHNAFTGRDTTSYYVTIAKEHLAEVMNIEADRIRGMTVSDAEAESEKKVIIEERRQRIENSPAALLNEQMNAMLFRHHPYRIPVIGWMHEMEGLTKVDVLAFHERYYHPNNAVLIMSGDVTAAEIKPLVEKYYGVLPSKSLPKREWTSEPPQIAARSVTLHHPHVTLPSFSRNYIAPSIHSGDKEQAFPLFVLSYMMGGGKNSILYRSLVVEQKLASEVDVDYDLYAHGPAIFSIQVVPEQGVKLEQIEAALDKELAEILKTLPDAAALDRTKRLMKAEAVYAREGLQNLSNMMGWMIMAGLPAEDLNHWQDHIAAVTAEQMQQAALAVFKREASVTGHLLPEKVDP